MRREKWRRIISCILVVCILVSSMGMGAQAASMPGVYAKPNQKNVMKIMDKYDKNGAYILRSTNKSHKYMNWFSSDRTIIEQIETAVHEQCHSYTWKNSRSFNDNDIYIGNRKKIRVKFTKIFRTKKMAKSIPKRCRTFRYSTYISDADPYLTANFKGVYGLMDEFTAYHWGMNNTVALFDYYKQQSEKYDVWWEYVNHGQNGRQAYAEFKYYILHYLYYAKKHNPKVYKGIMNNKKFRKAYRIIEKHYASLIKKFEKHLKKIGYREGSYPEEEYRVLCKELSKKKYTSIHKKLIRK